MNGRFLTIDDMRADIKGTILAMAIPAGTIKNTMLRLTSPEIDLGACLVLNKGFCAQAMVVSHALNEASQRAHVVNKHCLACPSVLVHGTPCDRSIA